MNNVLRFTAFCYAGAFWDDEHAVFRSAATFGCRLSHCWLRLLGKGARGSLVGFVLDVLNAEVI